MTSLPILIMYIKSVEIAILMKYLWNKFKLWASQSSEIDDVSSPTLKVKVNNCNDTEIELTINISSLIHMVMKQYEKESEWRIRSRTGMIFIFCIIMMKQTRRRRKQGEREKIYHFRLNYDYTYEMGISYNTTCEWPLKAFSSDCSFFCCECMPWTRDGTIWHYLSICK